MDRSRRIRPLAIATTVMLLAGLALIAVPARVSAGTAIVFSEDFESGQISPNWEVRDTNPLAGLDYWGISNYRVHGGNFSAWCAQVGTQSIGGQNNSDVHLYDDEMQADLVVNLSANGFVSLTLSFYYYSHTESGGGDWIQAWYEAGGTQFPIFNNTGGTGNKFDLASVAVPTNVERLIIRFHSDTANHGFEGAYVDDVVLTGSESTPPTSSVSSLPALTNALPATIADAAMTIDTTAPTLTVTSPASGATVEGSATVTWDASDSLSGIDHYEVSVDGGAFQSTGASPSATFGDLAAGDHTVTVRAYDRAGNVQTASVSFAFVPGGFPWWLIAIIVAVAAGLLLFFLWWKRRKDEEEEEGHPASGTEEPFRHAQETTGAEPEPEHEAPSEDASSQD